MSESEKNIALTRRWFDEVWKQRNDATVRELLHPESVGHLEGLVTRGTEEFFRARSFMIGAFPDFEVTVEDVIAQGSHVAVRWSAKGTHRGDQLDIPPTGKPITFRGLTWLTFRDGRIVEGWDAWNQGRLVNELQAAAQTMAQAVS